MNKNLKGLYTEVLENLKAIKNLDRHDFMEKEAQVSSIQKEITQRLNRAFIRCQVEPQDILCGIEDILPGRDRMILQEALEDAVIETKRLTDYVSEDFMLYGYNTLKTDQHQLIGFYAD